MSGQTEIMWGEEVIPDSKSVGMGAYEFQETEIGSLNSTWDVKPFEWFLQDNGLSYGVVQPGDDKAEGVPIIRAQNISGGKVLLNGIKLIDAKIESQYVRTRLKGDELLITVVGSLGDCVITDESLKGFNVARAVAVARFRNPEDRAWLKYCFQYGPIKAEIGNVANTTVQPTLNLKELRQIPFPVPSALEKNAIVATLSSLDDKIDLLHRQNATLEALAETLFRQWFVEQAKEEWEEVTVGDYVRMNDESIGKAYGHSVVEYLDTGSITTGKIDAFQTLTLAEAPSRARRLVKHNDILISTVRPDQKHYGIIKNPLPNLVVSTGFCVLSCQNINPHFIYCLLTMDEMIEFMHSIAEGSTSTYPSLKPSDIAKIEFRLPPKEMMDSFAAYADNAWEKIENNYIQIRTLSTLRDTLLPKLMSGEVRVAY